MNLYATRPQFFVTLLVSFPLLLLAGCSFSSPGRTSTPGVAISGKAIGGQQPLNGSKVYLLAVNNMTYGAASRSLLTTGDGTDSLGTYVLTQNGGNFSITGDYTCASDDQAYLYISSGNPGGGVNTAIGLIGALGACPTGDTTYANQFPHVVVNEVTTVAAAYALAGYAVDVTHIATSGTDQAKTGIANAFLTAADLVDIHTGQVRIFTPAGSGIIPVSEINTLANVLAACVNSTFTNPTQPPNPTICPTLFTNAKSGGASGTSPTETATAAINIAHFPGTNVSALYGIPTSTAPFVPHLATVPNDFSVGIQYPIGTNSLAFDADGNFWSLANDIYSNGIQNALDGVCKFGNNGAPLSPSGCFIGSGITHTSNLNQVALDPAGNVWVSSGYFPATLSKFDSSGSPLTTGSTPRDGYAGVAALAIDGNGSVWLSGLSGLSEFDTTGTEVTGSPFAFLGYSDGVENLTIDKSSHIWVTDAFVGQPTSYSVTGEFLGNGSVVTPSVQTHASEYRLQASDASRDIWGVALPFTGGVLSSKVAQLLPNGTEASNSPYSPNTALAQCEPALAIDGSGNAWCPSGANSIAEITPAGLALSPDKGYIVGATQVPSYIAIDNSGNVWTAGNIVYDVTTNTYNNWVVKLIGAATPVATPFSLAIKTGVLGARP